MDYELGLPHSDKNDTTPFGGSCLSHNLIYLYAVKKPADFPNAHIYSDLVENLEKEDVFWPDILQHEHVHAVLHRFKIPLKKHHAITDQLIPPIILGNINNPYLQMDGELFKVTY